MLLADRAPFLSKSAPIVALGVALSFTLNFPHGMRTEWIDMNTYTFAVERIDYRSSRRSSKRLTHSSRRFLPPICLHYL